jgi:hypothetical protein
MPPEFSAPSASKQSTHDNVAVRPLTADTHPDRGTICTFQRKNKPLLSESFVKCCN